jgi:hypothetical protein
MFHNDKVQLSDGSEKLIQDLAEEDEISDDFLKKIEKTNIR